MMAFFGLINCAVASHSIRPVLSYLSVFNLSISAPHSAKSLLFLPPLPFLTNPISNYTCGHMHTHTVHP